jgi:hypothetical protein
MTRPPIRQWTAAGVLAIVALSGCGSDPPKTAAATATATTAPPTATPTATPKPAAAAPKALRGSWKRTMTPSDWKPAGSGYPTGTFRLVIDPTGAMDVYFPNMSTVDFSTALAATGHRLTIDAVPVCPGVEGRYGWKASGREMTLEVVSDDRCAPRAALFGGTWRRR